MSDKRIKRQYNIICDCLNKITVTVFKLYKKLKVKFYMFRRRVVNVSN